MPLDRKVVRRLRNDDGGVVGVPSLAKGLADSRQTRPHWCIPIALARRGAPEPRPFPKVVGG